MTSLRALEVRQALDWLGMARDVAMNSSDAVAGPAIVQRIDIAVERIHSALDIKPSEDAIAEVVKAQAAA